MTLDEVIQFTKQALENVNPDKRVYAEFRYTVKQVKQLLEWLEDYKQLKDDYTDLDHKLRAANTENDELKRLLRLAVEDFQNVEEVCVGVSRCGLCPANNNCKWKHRDEAMELLGGAENAEN